MQRAMILVGACLALASVTAQAADRDARKVIIDPATGERLLPEDRAASQLEKPADQVSAPEWPTAERTAEGVKIFRLGPQHRTALRATHYEEGLSIQHDHDHDSAAE